MGHILIMSLLGNEGSMMLLVTSQCFLIFRCYFQRKILIKKENVKNNTNRGTLKWSQGDCLARCIEHKELRTFWTL